MSTEVKSLLEGCVGVVEANNFESMCLYERHKGKWVSASSGVMATVGMFDGLPVCLSILVHVVNDVPVLFYFPTSIAVNYTMIDEWLDENMPDTARTSTGRVNKTDAMNFYNIFPHKTLLEVIKTEPQEMAIAD